MSNRTRVRTVLASAFAVAFSQLALAQPAAAQSLQVIAQGFHGAGQDPKVVEVGGWSLVNNAKIQLVFYRRTGDVRAQRWRLDWNPYVPGWFRLINVNSGKCLDRFQAGNGSLVTQFTCHYGASQDWQPTGTASVISQVRNRLDGRCLHAQNLTSGSTMTVRTCAITNNQSFVVRNQF